jgi:EpsI family protein
MKSSRFWVVFAILLSTLVTLRLRGDVDRVPPSLPIEQMPQQIGAWTSQDIPMSKETLDILGDGRFLNRIYTKQGAGGQPVGVPVSLFIGYFPTQRSGQSIHSPQNCLPGAGWSFISSQPIDLKSDDGRVYRVGEYLIANSAAKQVVLYWYLAHGRSIANDYVAKAYMMADAIRWNRTDGALIRVVTPVQPNETIAAAEERAKGFAGQMTPLLPRYIPD